MLLLLFNHSYFGFVMSLSFTFIFDHLFINHLCLILLMNLYFVIFFFSYFVFFYLHKWNCLSNGEKMCCAQIWNLIFVNLFAEWWWWWWYSRYTTEKSNYISSRQYHNINTNTHFSTISISSTLKFDSSTLFSFCFAFFFVSLFVIICISSFIFRLACVFHIANGPLINQLSQFRIFVLCISIIYFVLLFRLGSLARSLKLSSIVLIFMFAWSTKQSNWIWIN